jgi:hypothetical protein
MHLAALKGEGDAGALSDGNWGYWVDGQLRARTLAGQTAVAVYGAASCGVTGQGDGGERGGRVAHSAGAPDRETGAGHRG